MNKLRMYERLLTPVTIPPDKFTTQDIQNALRVGGVVTFNNFALLIPTEVPAQGNPDPSDMDIQDPEETTTQTSVTTENNVYEKKECVFCVDTTKPHNVNFHSETLELTTDDPEDGDLITVLTPYIERVLEPIILGVLSRTLGYPICDVEEMELLAEACDPRVIGIRHQIGFATLMQVEYVQSNKTSHKDCRIEFTVLIDERFDEHQ